MSNVTSQSELTTKEIIEQAISDYHESILPYLNGQVPTIANKFDKANLYSTDEQIVGRWIDGKPLYQKVIDFGAIPSGVLNQTVYESTETYYEHAHIINTFAVGSGVNCHIPIVNASAINFSLGYSMYVNSTTHKLVLDLYTAMDRSGFGHFWATVQYTKTKDEAIAIGSDTDYSLEEKIVGTWIDGKKLYQKTIECGNVTATGNLQTLTVEDITGKNLVNVYGFANWGNSQSLRFLPFEQAGTYTVIPYINDNVLKIDYKRDSGSISVTNITLTIQYTKTIG